MSQQFCLEKGQAVRLTFFAFCRTLCVHLTNLLFGKSRINNKHNAINSEGCLSNVSRHNTLATNSSIGSFRWSRVKNTLLLSRRKSRIERNAAQLSNLWTQVINFLLQPLASFLDFLQN